MKNDCPLCAVGIPIKRDVPLAEIDPKTGRKTGRVLLLSEGLVDRLKKEFARE